ncbi:MAG: hypothetical protein Q4Q62_07760 [Thermoplasmata archaeon]|nr:hypothetical protein [Thermoplasmata archaeon]
MEPSNYLGRGVKRKECIEGRTITHCVFDFDRPRPGDTLRELSIQWFPNEESVSIFRSRERMDGTPAFKLGVAVLTKKKLDAIQGQPEFNSMEYKVSPSQDNPYHGLILFPDDRPVLKNLKLALAGSSEFYELDEDLPVG